MSATNAFETDLLELILQNVDAPNVGDAGGLRGSVTAGVFYVNLATAALSDTSTQATSEATYTGYGRISIARSAGGWTVSANVGDNAAEAAFAECTAGSSTVTHFGLGSASTSTGNLFLHAALTVSRAISAGITPRFAIGALDISLD